MKKIAVVLLNLGGPDAPQAVEPFLFNLFNDKAIISAPQPFRWLIAKLISSRRAPIAQEIYEHLGGKSPLLELTQQQADALETELNAKNEGVEYKVFISMRYWHPMSEDSVPEVKAWGADEVVLLPLYPQFSTTTTGSSLKDWQKQSSRKGLDVPTACIGCYPSQERFVASHATLLRDACQKFSDKSTMRILFSAHGLPQKVVDAGDPYQWQVEQTVAAIMKELDMPELEAVVCYQSKVGPLKWLEPSTEAEIERAGKDGKSLIVVPIAFVSEHSETLVELDIEYRELAEQNGVPRYERVEALGVQPDYILAMAEMCRNAIAGRTQSHSGKRLCPNKFTQCACQEAA